MSEELDDTRATPVARAGPFCIHCGNYVGQSARFCANCGQPVAPSANSTKLARRVASSILILIISFLLGLPVGVVAFRFVHRADASTPHHSSVAAEVIGPQQSVNLFYTDLNRRSFRDAFALLSPSERTARSFEDWEAGFRTTTSQRATVTEISATSFAVDLEAQDRDADGTITTVYKGTWNTVNVSGQWFLQGPNFKKITSSYFVAGPRSDAISGTYARLKHSLALIANEGSSGLATGSGFCIASNAETSYFLTNHHVIGDDGPIKVLLFGRQSAVDARVVSIAGNPSDAAIIAVGVGALPVLPLAASLPPEGRSVGVAGYPAIQVELALQDLGLSPSLHEGTVNALPDNKLIEYDAQTDHGNSGGPLFDAATGEVYGVVTWGMQSSSSTAVQNDFAQSITTLRSFIVSAGISPFSVGS